MKKILLFFIPIISLLLLWEFFSRNGFVNMNLFPPPTMVFKALYEMAISGSLFVDLANSLWRLVMGLFFGSIVGILLGLITGGKKIVSDIFSPIIQTLRPLPQVAIIPLVIVWFGIGDGAKIFSIAFAVFFPVWLNTNIGVRSISNEFLWSAKLLTTSFFKIFYKVIFPASLPFIVAGVRTGIAVAFMMIFVSELAGSSSGLGYRISIASLSYRIDEMIASLFILGLLGATVDQSFIFCVNKIFSWLNISRT